MLNKNNVQPLLVLQIGNDEKMEDNLVDKKHSVWKKEYRIKRECKILNKVVWENNVQEKDNVVFRFRKNTLTKEGSKAISNNNIVAYCGSANDTDAQRLWDETLFAQWRRENNNKEMHTFMD